MMEPQPDDVDTVHLSRREVTAITVAAAVAVAMTTLSLGCFVTGVLSRISGKFPPPPCLDVVAIYPVLATSIWSVLAVFLYLKIQRATSRIEVNGDRERLTNGSDDVDEFRMVQPPMQPPLVPIIPSPPLSSDGGVRATGNLASAADLQVGGESHHRRSERGGREVECLERRSAMVQERMLDEDRWCRKEKI